MRLPSGLMKLLPHIRLPSSTEVNDHGTYTNYNDGADLDAKDESLNGVTVGKGAGNVAMNTVVGNNALDATF